jgi:mycothiol synthase
MPMLQIRTLAPAERAQLSAMLDRVARRDGIEPFTEYKAMSLVHGLGHTLVAADDETLVGAAHAAWHHGDGTSGGHWAIEVVVDTTARDQKGTAAALLDATSASIPEDVRHVVWGRSRWFDDVVLSRGYRPTRRLLQMEVALPIEESPVFPESVHLAGFRPGHDSAAWLATNNAAFAGHPENGGVTPEELADRMSLDWFRPEDLLMAWEGDHLVGSCWTKRHPHAVGEIYIIGVHPAHQGRGLGRALVTAGLEHLSTAAGATTGMLYVDHGARGANMLYRRLGFRAARVTTAYEAGAAGAPHGSGGGTATDQPNG